MAIPTQIKRVDSAGIEVTWDNGTVNFLPSKLLRANCPAADSKEKRGDGSSHAKPLGGGRALLNVVKNSIEEELNLKKIEGVGNYAIRLVWADGHDSGIFSYDYLFELCKKEATKRV